MRITTGTVIKNKTVHTAYDRFMDWLVYKGYFPYRINANIGYYYVVAWDKGAVVSLLSYTYASWDETFEIRAAWTHEDYRRMGLYSKLFNKLVEIGKSRNIVSINSGYNADNLISAEMQKKRGSVITETYGKDIATAYYLKDVPWAEQKQLAA